jgi:hypothetical protein
MSLVDIEKLMTVHDGDEDGPAPSDSRPSAAGRGKGKQMVNPQGAARGNVNKADKKGSTPPVARKEEESFDDLLEQIATEDPEPQPVKKAETPGSKKKAGNCCCCCFSFSPF